MPSLGSIIKGEQSQIFLHCFFSFKHYAFLGFNLKVSLRVIFFLCKNMSKLDVQVEFLYPKTMESFLSIIV